MNYSEPAYDDVSNKWVINIYYDDGNLKDSEEFDTKDEASKYREKMLEKEGKEISKKEKKELMQKSTFIENMAAEMGDDEEIIPKDSIFGAETEEELQEKIDQHKTEFEEEEEKCKTEAKNLLLQVAKVYLDGEFIEDNEYLKFKLQLEEKGLAGLVFQLNVTRRAVFKLSEKIHTDEATPRHFEVLTGMNRVILDITKYQHEHLAKLEESMKRFSSDAEEAKIRKNENNENEVLDAEGTVIETRHRKELLKELNGLIKEADKEKIPKSRNSKLHDDDPNVVEVDLPEYEGESDEELGDALDEGGLSTWTDEDDEE